jgi:hypothetical protein
VNEVIKGDLITFDQRISGFEKVADDIKESQIKMMGAFRGRNLP